MGIYFDDGSWSDPSYEEMRLAAIDRIQPLRSSGDKRLESILRTAAELYGTAAAAISIIDWNRQVFVARVGTDLEYSHRQDALCNVAIQRPGEPLIVPDASSDQRFAHMKPVQSAPNIRFYAGNSIVDEAGYPLGALCVFDPQPRRHGVDPSALAHLARQVERVLNP